MADILIQIQPDATGWHSNLCYPSPYLRDGWAVVAPGDQEALRQFGGVVDFDLLTAQPSQNPEIIDRRRGSRGAPYPVAANMRQGTYVPPAIPEPDPVPEDTEARLSALEEGKADKAQVEALWSDMAEAYGEGVNET